MSEKRATESEDERGEINDQNKANMSKKRSKQRSTVGFKEALKSKEVLIGSHEVVDLKESNDSIGNMKAICQYCDALKFKKETSSTCCGNGKVLLDPFPVPPPEINNLWHANTTEGRVFRENARSINNAVCLSSIKVKSCQFANGFIPNIIFEGKVQ